MDRRIFAFELFIIVATLVAALLAYQHLPPQIPTHWGMSMQADGYSSRSAIFWLGPGLLSGLVLFTRFAPWLSPARYNVQTFDSTWQRLMLLIFCLLACFFGIMLWSGLGHTLNVVRWMAGTFSLFLVLFGNLLGKVRPNFFLGIRTPWTLANESVWIATHRIGAWLTALSGLCGLGLVLAGRTLWFAVPFVLALVVSAGYSFVLDKKAAHASSLVMIACLLLHPSLKAQNHAPDPTGDWVGSLQVQSHELHLALHVTVEQNGVLHAAMDSIDQGAKGILTDGVKMQGNVLSFDVPAIHGHYQGTMNSGGTTIAGTWTQGEASLPLTWQRGQTAAVLRPQEPKAPFQYKQEDVWVENARAGVRLAGTLTEPEGKGPFPAVLLITGSGPQDRDETVFGHKPFLVLADFLTRHGLAVLRVDDRGTAKSTGDFKKATTEDFASDALAAVTFLNQRSDIDHKHIGLIGHSEGGIIAPMVALESPEVSYIVLLAGTAVPGEVLLPNQVYLANLAEGQSEADAAAASLHLAEFVSALDRNGGDTEKAVAAMLDRSTDKSAQARSKLEAEARTYATPWFRFFATYDPYPTLRKVACPVLALNGSKDVQVPAALNIPFLQAATAWNPRSLVRVEPGMNHLFQRTETGSPMEYARNSETMSPVVLQQISDWIHQQL